MSKSFIFFYFFHLNIPNPKFFIHIISIEYWFQSLNEQLFHTKTKGFVGLHPQSYFGSHPECLQLQDSDIEVPPDGYYSKRPLSCKHQLLCFLTLLETTKPFLLNTIRMPTAQTLFLCAQTIETNQTFTRYVTFNVMYNMF